MIKNNAQLKKARERLGVVREQLQKYRSGNGDANGKFLIVALETELEQIIDQITEYQNLMRMPFEMAVGSVLNKDSVIDNIGELLSKLRIASKLSQSEMAEKLGWEQSNLSRFESENYSSQTINKIVEYASALGVWLHVVPSVEENIKLRIDSNVETTPFAYFHGLNDFMLNAETNPSYLKAQIKNLDSTSLNLTDKEIEYQDVSDKTEDVLNLDKYISLYSRSEQVTSV